MFNVLHYKNLFRFNSIIHDVKIRFLLNPIRKCHYQTNPTSSLVEYLQSSLGFPSEGALKVFQRLKGQNPKNPDAVVTFFKTHGLSETHIKSIINRAPTLLLSDPESSLGPKIEFFQDKGISEPDLAALMVSSPHLFTRSLEEHVKPVLNLLRGILGTDEIALQMLIRSKLNFHPDKLSANLTILRNCGVPKHYILKLFKKWSRMLMVNSDRLNEVVEMVKGMGLKPQSYSFVLAVLTIVSLGRQTWDANFKLYTGLGWSTEEVLSLFRKKPACMALSKEKIRKSFDYWTKELGCGPSHILINPNLLFYSLEKRIIPRHMFLQFLASKGFFKKDETYVRTIIMNEKKFLKNFVIRYESKVPDILKIYKGLISSKLLKVQDGEGSNVQ